MNIRTQKSNTKQQEKSTLLASRVSFGKKGFWKCCGEILLVMTAVYVLMNYLIISAYIPTESMKKTIMPGDRVLGIRFLNNYRRGDIIIVPDPEGSGNHLIKRIVGLPGDTLEIKEGCNGYAVFINGEQLQETYLPERMEIEENLAIKVPEGGYFLMGDNRNQSYDARYWEKKIVFSDQITGKVLVRYWPLKRMGVLK